MKEDTEEIIKIKVAIVLRNLLKRNKSFSSEKAIANSHEKISTTAGIRKATVTSAFKGTTRTAMTTIILILEAMEYSLIDFAEAYNKVSIKEIEELKREITNKINPDKS
ncbi:hypothetical protein CMU84_08255 [Elizabethkingia anophelis]|nr:hypothetical protein [Elizabethkingia anophelis]MDV3706759.1 hypothetical protein [Elizabethkingia anophelis]MDV3735216.1 hypothetical protein [Elizabethkingia anophelis]